MSYPWQYPILVKVALLLLLAYNFAAAAPNRAPTVRDDNFSVNEDIALVVSAPGVLGNDLDADGDLLSAVRTSDPTNGTVVSFSPDGSFTYRPGTNFNGIDAFTYRANDGRGASANATVTITVNAVNDPPVVVDDSHTVTEDGVLAVAPPGVLINDFDVEGSALTASRVGTTFPRNGTVSLNANGSFVYTPDPNFNGTDAFIYRARDSSGAGTIGTVSITVVAVNDRPVVENRTLDVAANDTSQLFRLEGTDVDGDSLTFSIVSGPSNGSLTLSLPTFRYTPNNNFVGNDSFTYRASDGQLNSFTRTVTLRVKPTLTIANVSLVEGDLGGNIFALPARFEIRLSPAVSFPVDVRFFTDNITATPGVDYQLRDDVITIPAGQTSYNDAILVYGDLDVEADETFRIRLESSDAIVLRSSLVTIINDDAPIGVTEGVPPDVVTRVGERIDYAVQWTHPERWRLLDTIDIRIRDDQGEVLTVRFDEANNTFSLFDLDREKLLRPAEPGSRTRFETSAAVVYLESTEVIGSGPTGPSVLLKLSLSFKPHAAGRVLHVEAFATDDSGVRQGFDPVGTITVEPR